MTIVVSTCSRMKHEQPPAARPELVYAFYNSQVQANAKTRFIVAFIFGLPKVMTRRVNLLLPPESRLKKEAEGSFFAALATWPLPSSSFWLLLPGCFPPSLSPARTVFCFQTDLQSHTYHVGVAVNEPNTDRPTGGAVVEILLHFTAHLTVTEHEFTANRSLQGINLTKTTLTPKTARQVPT